MYLLLTFLQRDQQKSVHTSGQSANAWPQVRLSTFLTQAIVFPFKLQSFGLDVEKFQHMTGDCPHEFLQTALCCCQVTVSQHAFT